MSAQFDLEQAILNCWDIVEDIKLLREHMAENSPSADDVDNYMLGLQTIYAIKFEHTFNIFENLVQEIHKSKQRTSTTVF